MQSLRRWINALLSYLFGKSDQALKRKPPRGGYRPGIDRLEDRRMPSGLVSLATFNGTDGANPIAGLIMDSSGNLYGTTEQGGSYGYGTIFELAKQGNGYSNTPTTLATFNGSNGGYPVAGLLIDASGNLYGTTAGIGAGVAGVGTVFELVKESGGYSNSVTTLASFSDSSYEGYPQAGLIMDSSGDLYGTTNGGPGYDGTVFELLATPGQGDGYSNTATTLATFNGTNGELPDAGLSAYLDEDGGVFELAKQGSGYSNAATTLATFGGLNGSVPIAGLIMDGSGNLYGTTAGGGAYDDGTVFEIVAAPTVTGLSPTTGPAGGGTTVIITGAAAELTWMTSVPWLPSKPTPPL